MKKIVLLFVLAFSGCAMLLGAEPTLKIIGDKAQEVVVDGKTVNFDGEVRDFGSDKAIAFGQRPLAVPAKTLISEKGSMIMEFAIDTKASKSAARPLACIRLDGTKQISFFTFHGNPVIQLRFGTFIYTHRAFKLAANKIYQAAVTWDGEKVCFYLDGALLKEFKQPCAIKLNLIGDLTVGPFQDKYFVTPVWDNDCFMKQLQVYNTALTADEIKALNK